MEHLGKSRGLGSWRKGGNSVTLWHSLRTGEIVGTKGHRDGVSRRQLVASILVSYSINSLLIYTDLNGNILGAGDLFTLLTRHLPF